MSWSSFAGVLSGRFKATDPDALAQAAASDLMGFGEANDLEITGAVHVDELLQRVADRFHMEIKRADVGNSSQLGRLYPRRGGFIIKIRQQIAQSKFRFVVAHEQAHLFAYDSQGSEPMRMFDNSRDEERMCDRIARHMLLPEIALKGDLGGVLDEDLNHREPLSLFRLSAKWAVSPWHIVRRAVERHKAGNLVALLWQRPLTAETDRLLIAEQSAPPGIYIPVKDRSFKGGRFNQAPWRALDRGTTVACDDEVAAGSLRGRLRSLAIPSRTTDAVIELIWLDENHLKKVEDWHDRRSSRLAG